MHCEANVSDHSGVDNAGETYSNFDYVALDFPSLLRDCGRFLGTQRMLGAPQALRTLRQNHWKSIVLGIVRRYSCAPTLPALESHAECFAFLASVLRASRAGCRLPLTTADLDRLSDCLLRPNLDV